MADLSTISVNLIHAGFGLVDDLPVFTGSAWEEHVQSWMDAESEVTVHRWRQAAICASITTHYGESSVERFAQSVGCHPRRIYEYRAAYQLARAFCERPQNLEFSHFVIASAAPDPVAALEAAADQTMTTRQLKAHIAEQAAPPVDASLPAIVEDRAVLKAFMEFVQAGRNLAYRAPITGAAVAYAIEEIKYSLELPAQSVADRIVHIIGEMGINELDPIANTIGQHRDRVKVWLNRMVEGGKLALRKQELDERTPGGRGPARTYYEVTTS